MTMTEEGLTTPEEWEGQFPMKLPPLCEVCGEDASDGQSSVEGVRCPEHLPKNEN